MTHPLRDQPHPPVTRRFELGKHSVKNLKLARHAIQIRAIERGGGGGGRGRTQYWGHRLFSHHYNPTSLHLVSVTHSPLLPSPSCSPVHIGPRHSNVLAVRLFNLGEHEGMVADLPQLDDCVHKCPGSTAPLRKGGQRRTTISIVITKMVDRRG